MRVFVVLAQIYVVGSATENGIYILDFFPDATSPSHVDYKYEALDVDPHAFLIVFDFVGFLL